MDRVIEAVVFDIYGTLLQHGEARHPFRQLMKLLRSRGRKPQPDDSRTLMTNNVGLIGAAALFDCHLNYEDLSALERDLHFELASIRAFEDGLVALKMLREAGYKLAACSNLAAPYAIPAYLLLPEFDVYAWSFEIGAIKPEPLIYEYVADALDCDPGSIAMVGDTFEADVSGPISAGISGFFLQRGLEGTNSSFGSLVDFAERLIAAGNRPPK
ncbi:haloacid dehalogenase [Metapseudomonas resinovorans]|uniref:HAD family hydrolase n=1 Tax=Metapseudomonas resinovorans TaxID=53412 RepID=UPI001F332377|nr:HAD family hydrolase [Pseudomonas resinovorans]GLZ86695.1 haloacid dehalogenase [Pseudomonas resinovorans]